MRLAGRILKNAKCGRTKKWRSQKDRRKEKRLGWDSYSGVTNRFFLFGHFGRGRGRGGALQHRPGTQGAKGWIRPKSLPISGFL